MVPTQVQSFSDLGNLMQLAAVPLRSARSLTSGKHINANDCRACPLREIN
jgi:hypothetical protein